jgi:voltage-gated potassium channel
MPPAPSLKDLKRHRYLVLLLALVLTITLAVTEAEHPYLRESVATIMMAMVFVIVFDRRILRLISLAAGLGALIALWNLRLVSEPSQRVLEIVTHLGATLFFALSVSMVLRHLFDRRAVRFDDILGTMCGYLLAALAWANLYAAIELISPGAFLVTGADQPDLMRWHERESLFIYFSLTTLTTIDYGDVTPVAAAARSAAMFEGVFGQFYIAVVVAQLVGSKLAEAVARDSGERR